jgi:hypothetical protein
MTLTDEKFKKRYMTWSLWHTQLVVGPGPNGCCDAGTRSARKASTGLWREGQETSLNIWLFMHCIGFPRWGGTPVLIQFSRISHHKSSIFGDPQFMKPQYSHLSRSNLA